MGCCVELCVLTLKWLHILAETESSLKPNTEDQIVVYTLFLFTYEEEGRADGLA